VQHIHEDVFVGAQGPLDDDDFGLRILLNGVFEEGQTGDACHYLECECISMLVGVKLLENGVTVVVVKLFPNVDWLLEKQNFTYKIGTLLGKRFLEIFEDSRFAGANIAFDGN
jgi:hypothetical protein